MASKKESGVNNLYAVIMAGGKGTRFWPLSREKFPKQFLKLVGERTLIQDTIHRLDGLVRPENTIIVTTNPQRELVSWQTREMLGEVNCILEPEGKNTAPAIALSAFKLYKKDKNALLFVMPSDHYISDVQHFRSTALRAVDPALKGSIVTFGIRPSKPETGYGYIKAGRGMGGGVYGVSKFVEKPDHKTAKSYLSEGGYYWNSGMFLFKASTMIAELKAHMPMLHKAFMRVNRHLNTPREEPALKELYSRIKEQSIDYGVMEKSKKVVMVAAEFPWSDMGSWNSLDDVMGRDASGNVAMGNVVALESKDNIFFAGGKLVATVGLSDMVVVDTTDATLIIPKSRVQDVKKLVEKLKEVGKEEYLMPGIEERPWGWFSVLEQGPTHKIKHIYIKPKGKLSLQMHNHRSEHWIVVSGTAKVRRGDEVIFVNQNESTYIPPTTKHRLENPGLIPLRIVEIQSGEYLGEDDIIRFDDDYGRGNSK